MKRIINGKRWITVLYRRRKLRNHDFSILSNRCIGGVISHNLGEKFRSPTVNLIMEDHGFLVFCRHVKEYASCPVEQPTEEERTFFPDMDCPFGMLRGEQSGLPDIPLLFVHYKSFDQAKEKWQKRYQRINNDNLALVMDCKTYATEDLLDEFEDLPFDKKVVFTHRHDPIRWPHAFQFSFYTKEKHKNGILYRKIQKGTCEFRWMDEFDVVSFLNEGVIQKSDLQVL